MALKVLLIFSQILVLFSCVPAEDLEPRMRFAAHNEKGVRKNNPPFFIGGLRAYTIFAVQKTA